MSRTPIGIVGMTDAERPRRRPKLQAMARRIRLAMENVVAEKQTFIEATMEIVTAMAEVSRNCESDEELKQWLDSNNMPPSIGLYQRAAWIALAEHPEAVVDLIESDLS
jgi:hypothetical protein